MSASLAPQLAVQRLGDNHFKSESLPKSTGNAQPIAYGGCTIAVCTHSAILTVPPQLHVYAISGVFLGPTKTDRHVYCRVTQVRTSKSFASRHTLAYQIQDDGSERPCMHCFVDFHAEEPALLDYTEPLPPSLNKDLMDKNNALSREEVLERAVQRGQITPQHVAAHTKVFKLMVDHFESKLSLDSFEVDNGIGIVKAAPTRQDNLPFTDRFAAEWVRLRQPLDSQILNTVALSFVMDAGLSFLPLWLNHMSFEDTAAVSTLEFSIRIMSPNVNLHEWHARERKTVWGSNGRTYSESKTWSASGQLVAVMSQTCILRKPVKKMPKL